MSEVRAPADFDALPKQFEQEAAAWINAGGDADRSRRQLAAATFALEAARADEWREWKRIIQPPEFRVLTAAGEDTYQPLNSVRWGPAPKLIEWGCRLLRSDKTPRPIERIWQLAALSVAERSEDPQFLVGDPSRGLGVVAGEILNEQDEIRHLDHVEARFPGEARFTLAQGVARFRNWPEDASKAFGALSDHPDVGGEAIVREGQLLLSQSKFDLALARFDRAEQQTRDSYVLYLAAYLRGVALERTKQPVLAETAYRRAVRLSPGAQSAALALSAILVRQDKVAEARELATAMLRTEPPAADPWREFVHADDRFWPGLIARLRREIHP